MEMEHNMDPEHSASSLNSEYDDAAETTQPLLSKDKVTSATLPKPHIFNSDHHSAFVRYSIPIFLIATFSFLMASDIGIGASAHIQIGGQEMTGNNSLEISIFTSVQKLWEKGAHALAILIVCTSISWPYVKLIMTLYAWVTPFDIGCRRQPETKPTVFMAEREKLLFWLDIMGKFAFVDTFILCVLMVVFRMTVEVFGIKTEVWVTPRWGMYGFMCASILSIFGTQIVLHLHRGVQRQVEKEGNKGNYPLHTWEGNQSLISQSGYNPILVLLALLLSIALLIFGATSDTFNLTYSGMTHSEASYSLISIGLQIPEKARQNGIMIHFLQAFYFIITIGVPIASCLIYAALFFIRGTPVWARRLFVMAEMALAWSAMDVYMLSTIFAVAQIPNFAKHLVEEKCKDCFTIDAEIDPKFALICAGALVNFSVGLLLVSKAQGVLFAVETVRMCGNKARLSLGSTPNVVPL